jgi:hypothetical protein
VNKIRQNITALFLAAAMLVSGNFAFAVTHLGCMVEESTHHTCEMECCEEGDCCEGESSNFSPAAITADDNCCEVHVEQASYLDYTIPLSVKNTDVSKNVQLKSDISSDVQYKTCLTASVYHNIKPQNIYLTVLNLRI